MATDRARQGADITVALPEPPTKGEGARRNLVARATGLAILAVAGCLKVGYDAIAGSIELSTGIRSVMGLVCFLITCLGAILLVEGARVRERWLAALDRKSSAQRRSAPSKSRARETTAAARARNSER